MNNLGIFLDYIFQGRDRGGNSRMIGGGGGPLNREKIPPKNYYKNNNGFDKNNVEGP